MIKDFILGWRKARWGLYRHAQQLLRWRSGRSSLNVVFSKVVFFFNVVLMLVVFLWCFHCSVMMMFSSHFLTCLPSFILQKSPYFTNCIKNFNSLFFIVANILVIYIIHLFSCIKIFIKTHTFPTTFALYECLFYTLSMYLNSFTNFQLKLILNVILFQVWHDIACYHKKWFICEVGLFTEVCDKCYH